MERILLPPCHLWKKRLRIKQTNLVKIWKYTWTLNDYNSVCCCFQSLISLKHNRLNQFQHIIIVVYAKSYIYKVTYPIFIHHWIDYLNIFHLSLTLRRRRIIGHLKCPSSLWNRLCLYLFVWASVWQIEMLIMIYHFHDIKYTDNNKHWWLYFSFSPRCLASCKTPS